MFGARFYGNAYFGPRYWGNGAVAAIEVPAVDGDAQADGTLELEGAGFVVVVATEYSSTVPAGIIISQSPVGGSFAVPGSTVTITVSLGERVGQTPAGKHRRHLYYVEVDGQTFQVEDAQHAIAVLDRAAELAKVAAQEQAEAIAQKLSRANVARRIGLATPSIRTDAPVNVAVYRERIRDAYKNAAIEAELRLHMALLAAREDEEAAVWLLL